MEKAFIGGAKVVMAAAVTAPGIAVSRRARPSPLARLRSPHSRPAIFPANLQSGRAASAPDHASLPVTMRLKDVFGQIPANNADILH